MLSRNKKKIGLLFSALLGGGALGAAGAGLYVSGKYDAAYDAEADRLMGLEPYKSDHCQWKEEGGGEVTRWIVKCDDEDIATRLTDSADEKATPVANRAKKYIAPSAGGTAAVLTALVGGGLLVKEYCERRNTQDANKEEKHILLQTTETGQVSKKGCFSWCDKTPEVANKDVADPEQGNRLTRK